QALALPLGFALFWSDSFLPPFKHMIAQAGQLATFRASYLLELAGRLVNFWMLGALVVLLALHLLLARKLRMASFALLALAAACAEPLWQHPAALPQAAGDATLSVAGGQAADNAAPTAAALDAALNRFYADESKRRVAFPAAMERKTPFDVVYLQICSLAQDDLDYAGTAGHPLWNRFNLRFSNFSTGASYSGPAAIRLLRSGCGQPKHEDLYKPTDGACYLFDDLKRAGFEPQWLLNHSGVFGNFIGTIQTNGGMSMPPLKFPDAAVAMRSFDDQPVQDDYDVLAHWWAQRLKDKTPQVSLFYNTVTLHDGNRLPGAPRMDPRESFAVRSKKMFDDFGRFFDLVQASGRRMVVVLVPEHGANVRGDKMQISGLREIPSPAIALAPVGIGLINLQPSAPLPPQLVVSDPTAHLAISHVVSQLLINSPFDNPPQDWKPYVTDLPQTNFVAENEGMIVMRVGTRYYLRNPDTSWVEYSTQ
ncbi:MAG TPA: cellulose biosynthesis protein BcsG, partial [Nevskiaceae bacterium]|nr:cellulose biosynthesis protein BcsG [Nevskiaceae bacterium]